MRQKKIPAEESIILEDFAPAGKNTVPIHGSFDLDEGHFREASDWPSRGKAIRAPGGFSV
ncbi:MAG: hypothetical protein WB622_19725 [Acidobacteriaceae bacterium]